METQFPDTANSKGLDMNSSQESPYIGLPEAAALINIHKSTLFRWIKDGGAVGWKLQPMKRGKLNVFKRNEVIAEYERIMTPP